MKRSTAIGHLVETGEVSSEQLGHSTTQITRDIYVSVMPQVVHASAEAAAALVPRAPMTLPEPGAHISVPTVCPPEDMSDIRSDLQSGETAGQTVWGGRDSNPRPRDYESPALTS